MQICKMAIKMVAYIVCVCKF